MSNNSSSFNPMKPFLVFMAILIVLWLMIGGIELTGILPGTSKNLVKRRKISDVKKLLKKLYDSESGDDPTACSEIRDWWDDNQDDYEEANEDELPDEIYVWKNFWPSKMDTDEFLNDYMEDYGGSDYETKFLKLAEGTAKCEDEIKGTTSDLNKLKTIYTKMNVTSYQPDAAGVDCADLKAVKDLILPNFVWSYDDDGFIDSKEYRNEFIGKKSGDKDPTNLYNTTCLNQVSFNFKTYNAKVAASGTGATATQARSANVHINNIKYGDPFFKLEIKDTNTGRVLGKHTFSSGDNKPTTGTTDPGVVINLDDPYASDTTTGFKPIVYEMFLNGVSMTPYFSNFGMQFDKIKYNHVPPPTGTDAAKSDHKFVLTNYKKDDKDTNAENLKFWVCGTGVGTGTGTTGSVDIGLKMNDPAGTKVNGTVDAKNDLVTDFAAGTVPAGATYTLYVYDSTKLTTSGTSGTTTSSFECHKPSIYITGSSADIPLTQGAYKIGTFKIDPTVVSNTN